MTEFEFNCMTTANRIIDHANRQHHLSVYQAKARQYTRAAIRIHKQHDREAALDLALRIAIAIGIVTVGWFLTSIFGK